jgi:MATE family multidrug resistance protein
VGRLGTAPLAATSLAFNLNGLVFMPMLGLGVGVSSLVARYLGSEQPDVAERVTWSAFKVSLLYMALCGLLYLLLPRLLLAPFAAGSDPAAFAPIEDTAVALLRFVAFYSIFDMFNVIFAAGLKGAGDTAYPLKLTIVLAWVVLLVPTWLGCVLLPGGVYVAWSAATAYVFCLGLLMQRRFRAGGWKALRIVEPQAAEVL